MCILTDDFLHNFKHDGENLRLRTFIRNFKTKTVFSLIEIIIFACLTSYRSWPIFKTTLLIRLTFPVAANNPKTIAKSLFFFFHNETTIFCKTLTPSALMSPCSSTSWQVHFLVIDLWSTVCLSLLDLDLIAKIAKLSSFHTSPSSPTITSVLVL